ncbi:general secretion pathway protein G [Clostridium sp. CAG:768]|mgnify:CR=1 FL=1|nr:general secretion pathway protein G [Clostridium sp. CAG:768]
MIHHYKRKSGFTLAEVLITLGIIGVVAALTIPTVLSKYREKVYLTQLKKMVSMVEKALERINVETGSICDTYTSCYNKDVYSKASCFNNILFEYGDIDKNSVTTKYVHPAQSPLYFKDGSSLNMNTVNATATYTVFTFDVNGTKKPNKGGIDQFVVHYYPCSLSYVKRTYKNLVYDLVPMNQNQRNNTIKSCSNNDAQACIKLILDNNFEKPSDYPLKF